jgi:hypothetical protein
MYHNPALNCRCSSHTYAPFQTTTVGNLLKEYKFWHHEETLRNGNGKCQSCHCELELSCKQKWNPSQCKELTRFWDTTACLVNATMHNRLTILELQNELISFCYAPNCILSFVILFPQWWSEMEKAGHGHTDDLSTNVCTTAKIPHNCFHYQTWTIEMVPVEHHARHQMVAFCMQLLSKICCQPQIQVSSIYQVQFNKKLGKKRKCDKCDSYHEMNLILNKV